MYGEPDFSPEERVEIEHDRLDGWATASIDDISADHDDLDPDRHVEDLEAAERLANGRLIHVLGAGHTIFRDRFQTSAKALRAFLRRI